ncbi:DUF2169 domain-containing protein [Rhizobium sp. XQZ8]|uniref:DUF2169 family type VI secretion system accessory protein n=1 Tax=Rhizobium populisoli TaxID=2859785 RepID=UPI001C6787E4|nr:DUF2169 domain-containing protein [Rhizobium populisoli]MBW6422194.1 DUF2169 domain-containing protein [Rhizobium populisoli]
MTELYNTTVFPHLAFSNSDNQGREFGVILVKAAFDIDDDGRCKISDDQEPLCFTDRCHGDVNVSSLRQPSDLVSYKPGADIIVDATAFAPEGRASSSWTAGVSVLSGERLLASKQLRVTGPRRWMPVWPSWLSENQKKNWQAHRKFFKGWKLSEPEETLSVPIRYELAYGGLQDRGLDEHGNPIIEAFEENPVGSGWFDPEQGDLTGSYPAPQIEALNDPIRDAAHHYKPEGFGPIPPAWLPRRKLGGTFDQQWLDTVAPKWPADYDFAYNNSAAEGLILNEFPTGDLTIVLENLRPGTPRFTLTLPDPMITMLVDAGDYDIATIRPNLDTIFLSVSSAKLFDCRVQLTWRMPFNPDTTEAILLAVPDKTDTAELAALAGAVRKAPHPDACGVYCKELERET